MEKKFQQLLELIRKEEDTKILKTKNGYFFYRGLDEDNRGKFRIKYRDLDENDSFKIKSKVEYKTGYQYETFICQEDINTFDEFAEEQITNILFSLGFNKMKIEESLNILL